MKLNRKKFEVREVKAVGSEDPGLYIVTDLPTSEDSKAGRVLSGIDRVYIKDLLRDSGIIDLYPLKDIRIKASMAYRPIFVDFNTMERSNRNPSPAEIAEQRELLLEDIINSDPEFVIVSGRNAAKALKLDHNNSGEFVHCELIDKSVYLMDNLLNPTYSSSEANRRRALLNLQGELLRFKNEVTGNSIDYVEENLTYDILDGFTLSSLEELEAIFYGHDKLVLDYETSGLDPYSPDFHLAGIGLSSMDCTRSAYVSFYNYNTPKTSDNPIPEECLNFIREFFKKKAFVVYNAQYELAVTASSSVGISLNLEKVEDVLMSLRCMAKGSSLKNACMNFLGAKNWSDDIKEWSECVLEWMKLKKPTARMKGYTTDIEWILEREEKTLFDLREFFEDKHYSEIIKDLKRIAKNNPNHPSKLISKITSEEDFDNIVSYAMENSERLNSRKERDDIISTVKEGSEFSLLAYSSSKESTLTKSDLNTLKILDKIEFLVNKHYPIKEERDEFLIGFKSYLIKRLSTHSSSDFVSYTELPLKVVAPYCILDCQYTAILYKKVMEEIKSLGLEKANLYYNQHAYLGYILSKNGIAWDDELAGTLAEGYKTSQLEMLRSLILLLIDNKILKTTNQTILNIKTTTNLDDLKEVFNPLSSYAYKDITKTTKYIMSKAIVSPKYKIAALLYDIFEQSKQLVDPTNIVNKFPIFYPIYLEVISLDGTSARVKYIEDLLERGDEIKSQLINSFNDRRKLTSKEEAEEEISLFKKYINYELDSIDQEATSRVYSTFKHIYDINPDDDSEWFDEFSALYYFKIFKKLDKSLGAYLLGELGRKSVYMIKKEEAESLAPFRVSHYSSKPKGDDETYILKTDWGVCTATTKRWRAAQHTVPKKTELMDLRTTRYFDGVKVHYDFSQAEVRVLAAMSGDETLLNAYEQGLDVHRVNASNMWEKPMDEITDAERSMAKGVTFSILYGSSVVEFANKYLRGNVEEAENTINNFFRSYKNVDKFIKKMHQTGARTGQVPSLLGDPIYVDTPFWFRLLDKESQKLLIENPHNHKVDIPFAGEQEKKERAKLSASLRYSQNYPIQETSSMLGGLSIYTLQKLIEQHSLSTKIECFTHDSCDSDVRVKDLHKYLTLLDTACVDYIKEEFGVPMKIDIEIGTSNNQMIGLDDIEFDDYTLVAKFGGTESAFNALRDRLSTNGVKVDYKVNDEKEVLSSSEKLFLTKSAYARDIGSSYKSLSGEIKLEFSE